MTDNQQDLSPEQLQHNTECEGNEVESLGQTWRLATLGLARLINDERDRAYNDIRLYQDVSVKDIRTVAWYMLSANYSLTSDQAIAIIEGANQTRLIEAVLKGMFVHERTQQEEGYTAWARSSLLANGLDPAKISFRDMPHVLRQLVETGRAIKLNDFTIADQHAKLKAELFTTI